MEIDLGVAADEDRLIQGLPIVPMIKCGQPILDAVGWRQKPEYPFPASNFANLTDGFLSHGERRGKEFDEERGVRMSEMTPVLVESQSFHGGFDWLPTDGGHEDEIKVRRYILVLSIDRNTSSTGKDDFDSVLPAAVADRGGQVGERNVPEIHDNGFPVRRGLSRGL